MGKEGKKPLLVYLDYNVIVALQDNDYSVEHIKRLVGTSNVVFPFSASHIEEVKNIKDNKDSLRLKAIGARLEFIDGLTKRQYLERIEFDLPYKKRSVSAFTVFDTLNEVCGSELAYKALNNIVTEEQKADYRTRLNLDARILNNVKPLEIVNHLDTKFLSQAHEMTFMEMIKHARSFHPSSYKWGIETDIASVFAFLDVIGYWKDRYSDTSNVARFWDSSHCAFASFCDVLVSQDERMRLKSEVAYNLFNVKTRILSPI